MMAHLLVDLGVPRSAVAEALLDDAARQGVTALQLTQLTVDLHHLREEEEERRWPERRGRGRGGRRGERGTGGYKSYCSNG